MRYTNKRQTATNRNCETKPTTQTTINKIFKLQKCKMFAHRKQYAIYAIYTIWLRSYNTNAQQYDKQIHILYIIRTKNIHLWKFHTRRGVWLRTNAGTNCCTIKKVLNWSLAAKLSKVDNNKAWASYMSAGALDLPAKQLYRAPPWPADILPESFIIPTKSVRCLTYLLVSRPPRQQGLGCSTSSTSSQCSSSCSSSSNSAPKSCTNKCANKFHH